MRAQSLFVRCFGSMGEKTTMWAVEYDENYKKLIRRCRFYFPSNFGTKYKLFFFFFFREKYKVFVEKLCMYVFKCHINRYFRIFINKAY